MGNFDKEYLEFLGFKVQDGDVILEQRGHNKIPTLSCKLSSGGDEYVFVLSFYPDVDSYKFQKEFTFDEIDDIINSIGDEGPGEGSEKGCGAGLFYFFSMTENFVSKVRSARLSGGGRKPWKKRNWPLPIKWAKVKAMFGIKHVVDDELIQDCLFNMNVCVKKAAEFSSNQPFELYYEAYKRLLRLEGKKTKGIKKIAWSQFKSDVEKLQNCSSYDCYDLHEEDQGYVDEEDFDEQS